MLYTPERSERTVEHVVHSENLEDRELLRTSQDSVLLGATWTRLFGEDGTLENRFYYRDTDKTGREGEAYPFSDPVPLPAREVPAREDILTLTEVETEIGFRSDLAMSNRWGQFGAGHPRGGPRPRVRHGARRPVDPLRARRARLPERSGRPLHRADAGGHRLGVRPARAPVRGLRRTGVRLGPLGLSRRRAATTTTASPAGATSRPACRRTTGSRRPRGSPPPRAPSTSRRAFSSARRTRTTSACATSAWTI